jgi:hypothetical protein
VLDRVINDFLNFQQREEQANKTKPSKQEQLDSFRKFSQYLEKVRVVFSGIRVSNTR